MFAMIVRTEKGQVPGDSTLPFHISIPKKKYCFHFFVAIELQTTASFVNHRGAFIDTHKEQKALTACTICKHDMTLQCVSFCMRSDQDKPIKIY